MHVYFPPCRQVTTLSSDAAASDVTPITGTLTFFPGVTQGTVEIESLADSIPEPSDIFSVQLADVGKAGRIDDNTGTASLTGECVDREVVCSSCEVYR